MNNWITHRCEIIHGSSMFICWWFQPLWKIWVSWDYYSQYMESHKFMFQNHNQFIVNLREDYQTLPNQQFTFWSTLQKAIEAMAQSKSWIFPLKMLDLSAKHQPTGCHWSRSDPLRRETAPLVVAFRIPCSPQASGGERGEIPCLNQGS